MGAKLLFFVLFYLSCDLICIESLKPGAHGVCVVKSSIRKTRAKPINVTTNKWCGKKKCVLRRTKLESYMAWKTQAVCCSGWQYRSEDDSCIPHCSTGCNGGHCAAPDTCICELPAVIHPEHKNTCIIPDCQPPCFNGQCINKTCVCQANYDKFNTTHCYSCEPGFNIHENFTCIKCQCPNGVCVDNTCICNNGYDLRDNVCRPICDNCTGVCIVPNICQCLDGYANVQGKCEPICHDCNGICVKPNTCKCLDGYADVEGKCELKCNCKKCLAPNVCDCQDGYRSNNGTCVAICDECVNGYCSEPNVCVCNEEFMKNNDGVCQACSEVCTCNASGECLEEKCRLIGRRNITRCCDGFTYDSGSDSCRAKCNNGCKNGTCVTTNNCICTPPLVLINDNECTSPTCDKPCVHGQCTSRNICTCEPGFALIDNFTCQPKCHECSNGLCTAPNYCSCNVGYKFANGSCKPHCNPDCVNASCVGPNECKCLQGFRRKDNATCERYCDNCENGKCLDGNYCFCNEGYSLVNGICTPSCSAKCVNSICVAPNTCECLEGFVKNHTSLNSCYKNCICDNGQCVGEVCICHPGYELLDGHCKIIPPVQCESCEVSNCSGSVCQCKDGRGCYQVENPPEVDIPQEAACESCDGKCSDGVCRCKEGAACYYMEPAEVGTPTELAGLELSWLVGGIVGLAILTLVIIVMIHIWRKRQEYDNKETPNGGNEIGSVVYTVPDTLLTKREGSNVKVYGEYEDNNRDEDDVENVKEPLRSANDHKL